MPLSLLMMMSVFGCKCACIFAYVCLACLLQDGNDKCVVRERKLGWMFLLNLTPVLLCVCECVCV